MGIVELARHGERAAELIEARSLRVVVSAHPEG
jgi:hypothetical protein